MDRGPHRERGGRRQVDATPQTKRARFVPPAVTRVRGAGQRGGAARDRRGGRARRLRLLRGAARLGHLAPRARAHVRTQGPAPLHFPRQAVGAAPVGSHQLSAGARGRAGGGPGYKRNAAPPATCAGRSGEGRVGRALTPARDLADSEVRREREPQLLHLPARRAGVRRRFSEVQRSVGEGERERGREGERKWVEYLRESAWSDQGSGAGRAPARGASGAADLGRVGDDVGVAVSAAAHLELDGPRVPLLGLLDDDQPRVLAPRDEQEVLRARPASAPRPAHRSRTRPHARLDCAP